MSYRLPAMVAPPGPLPDRLACLADAAQQRAHQARTSIATDGWQVTADVYREAEQEARDELGGLPAEWRARALEAEHDAVATGHSDVEHRAWSAYYAWLGAADLAVAGGWPA